MSDACLICAFVNENKTWRCQRTVSHQIKGEEYEESHSLVLFQWQRKRSENKTNE